VFTLEEKKVYWEEGKKKNFKEALVQGYFHQLATERGGTGMFRRAWSEKEYRKNKKKRNIAKRSRKKNR
jgi:hypothetical protein